jgi:hypothetical protein
MRHSPEKLLLRRIEYFGHTIELVHRNHAALIQMIDYVLGTAAPRHLLDSTDDWRRHDMLKELSFRLHDYLSAVKSLVDHSRTLYNQLYRHTQLFPEYEPEVKRVFAIDGLVQTVQGLREMAQHYELPNVTLVRTFNENETSARIVLKRSDLLKYEGWKAPAKKFIATSGDEINLRELCTKHHEIVVEFYEWTYARLREIHAKEIQADNAAEMTRFSEFLPDILSSIAGKIAFVEHIGAIEMPWVFGQLLGPRERRALHKDEHDPVIWTDAALAVVATRAVMPDDLVASLRSLAERARQQSCRQQETPSTQ